MFFRNKQPPTRSELVLAADQARAKGRLRKVAELQVARGRRPDAVKYLLLGR